jgi:hypothetical protein
LRRSLKIVQPTNSEPKVDDSVVSAFVLEPTAVIIHDARTAERSADLWLVRVVPPACRS